MTRRILSRVGGTFLKFHDLNTLMRINSTRTYYSGLQEYQVDRENDNETFRHTPLAASKLAAATQIAIVSVKVYTCEETFFVKHQYTWEAMFV